MRADGGFAKGGGFAWDGEFALVAVTDRHELAEETELPDRMAELLACGVDLVVLREKDLDERSYEKLAREVAATCGASGAARLVLHGGTQPGECAGRVALARELGATGVHLPLPLLRAVGGAAGLGMDGLVLGASVHSAAEAREACELGASLLLAGHVFATGCKPGVPGRGLGFLAETVRAASGVPVVALGGMDEHNLAGVRVAGAAGAALRSAFMRTGNPAALVARLRAALYCPNRKPRRTAKRRHRP
jgi:thiamine-phosphate pyrophosphorylase